MAIAFKNTEENVTFQESINNAQIRGFSGVDCAVFAYFPALLVPRSQKSLPKFYPIGTIQTVSVSSQRSVAPVRKLGNTYPHAYTRGPRTYAGSMIFTLFETEALLDMARVYSRFEPSHEPFVLDKLPPINVMFLLENELGGVAISQLIGVTFSNTGLTISVDDVFTEQTVSYVATGYKPLKTFKARHREDPSPASTINSKFTFGTDEFFNTFLLGDTNYTPTSGSLFERSGSLRRRDQSFIRPRPQITPGAPFPSAFGNDLK